MCATKTLVSEMRAGAYHRAMSRRGGIVGSLVLALVAWACSSSSSSGGASLHPPSNIDLERCASVGTSACGTCCGGAGFSAASAPRLGDKCICGNPPGDPDAGAEVCAGQADCGSCCTAAGYNGYGGSSGSGSASCRCNGKTDKQSCASQSSPDDCDTCCLNAGYLINFYSDLDSVKCTCSAGL
jgi:hypothetical protein